MDFVDDNDSSIEMRHRKEKKELQAQTQALKKAAKNDKTKKKEILAEIVRLEIEMENRHQQELQAVQSDKSNKRQSPGDEVNIEKDLAKIKISKAQKRRDKKSQMEKEREQEIKLQEKENLHGPRNKEILEISTRLKKINLKIFAIPSDGDCLYKAVAHQMLIIRNETFTAEKLREDVATYIRKNKNDFLPFMTNPETLEMLDDDEFESYCDKIANTAVWGGQLEVRALSNLFKCPINIIQATGPECIEQGSEFEGPPLVITYHRHMYRLGEHYNSTCINDEPEN